MVEFNLLVSRVSTGGINDRSIPTYPPLTKTDIVSQWVDSGFFSVKAPICLIAHFLKTVIIFVRSHDIWHVFLSLRSNETISLLYYHDYINNSIIIKQWSVLSEVTIFAVSSSVIGVTKQYRYYIFVYILITQLL